MICDVCGRPSKDWQAVPCSGPTHYAFVGPAVVSMASNPSATAGRIERVVAAPSSAPKPRHLRLVDGGAE